MARLLLVQSAQYERNEKRCHEETPCLICGRPIKDNSAAQQLHLSYGGTYIITEDDPTVGTDADMDFFPVGPECAKKPELKPFLQ